MVLKKYFLHLHFLDCLYVSFVARSIHMHFLCIHKHVFTICSFAGGMLRFYNFLSSFSVQMEEKNTISTLFNHKRPNWHWGYHYYSPTCIHQSTQIFFSFWDTLLVLDPSLLFFSITELVFRSVGSCLPAKYGISFIYFKAFWATQITTKVVFFCFKNLSPQLKTILCSAARYIFVRNWDTCTHNKVAFLC